MLFREKGKLRVILQLRLYNAAIATQLIQSVSAKKSKLLRTSWISLIDVFELLRYDTRGLIGSSFITITCRARFVRSLAPLIFPTSGICYW